jgi:TolC family type I secretion outer membrane protein
MKIFSMLLLLYGAFVFPVSPATATEALPQPLTLSEAIAAAVKGNTKVVAARHEAESAAFKVVTARSGLLPQVHLTETYNNTNSPLWAFGTKLNQGVIESSDFNPDALNEPDAVNNFNTSLALSWNLYDGGQTHIGLRQARQGRQVAELGLERTEQHVIAQAAKSYVGLMLSGVNLDVIEQSLNTAKAHLKLVEDRFRGGLSVKSDVLRAKVRIADLEQQRLMARSRMQVAQAALQVVMGGKDEGPVAPSTSFEQCISPKGELSQWMEWASNRRPDLKQIDIQQDIAKKGVARAKSGHLPTVAVQGNYEINSEEFNDTHDNYTVGAMVRLNLYSGQRISSQTAAAKAQVAKLKAMRNGLALSVGLETQRAFYQAASAWRSIGVAHQAVGLAQEGLRIVGNRYAGGLLTIVDLLDSQVALQHARTRHFKAMHDYKVARIELALASGTIDKNFR